MSFHSVSSVTLEGLPDCPNFWVHYNLPELGHKRSTIFHYNDPEHETVDWPGLEAMMGPWSHREQVLMQVARALFDAGTEMPLPAL